MLTELEHHYGPLRDTAVVHNGRNPDSFAAAPKELVVLSAGRVWDAAKNIAALAAAAPHIKAPVVVAGEARSPDGDSADVRPARLLGALDAAELARWYGRAAVYVLPALYEPFGLTVLEAALSGCALVLGNIDSLREVWGDAACYVSPNDQEALCEVVNELLDHEPLRKQMSERARARAREFTPSRLANSYLSLYRRVRRERDLESLEARSTARRSISRASRTA
jgi:glycosyltransferase involved in cell wall biosynthesis